MKPKSSIIRLSLIGAAIIIGFVLAFCPFKIGFENYHGFASNIKLGLDLKGGVYAVYEANEDNPDQAAMDSTIASLSEILTSRGYTEATLQKEGTNKIRVSVPNVDNPEEILEIMGSPAEIEFMLGEKTAAEQGTGELILSGKTDVTGAKAIDYEGGYAVELSLTSSAATAFHKATGEQNRGKQMHVVSISGGVRSVVSSPEINDPIAGGKAVITGGFTRDGAQRLAQQISAGMFSLTLTQIEGATISATLGENALMLGLIAGAIGLILIIALMIYLYGLFGASSSIALLCYTVVMLFILAIFPWVQLTLPGIAGILLSIGMAIDGNIIICERIKDEYRSGKSILSASHYGFRKSISAILDGNITTIIAGIVLLIFGTGAVQGFAITLLIGILLALCSSLLLTPWLMRQMVRINDYDPKFFKLKRGKDFEYLGANQNDAMTELELQQQAQKKEAKRKSEEASQRGI